jgi:hypothetical protein
MKRFSTLSLTVLVCALTAATAVRASSAEPDTVTFSEHIAPIVFNNCTACHRQGQAAPF